MPDGTDTPTDDTLTGVTTDTSGADAVMDTSTDEEATAALGDAGKKALDAMKAERNAAKAEAKTAAAELAALKAAAEGREAEHKAEQEAQKVRDDALAVANQRILKAEVRAAAAGKLADPADALRFLDLSSIEVGEDGEIEAATVATAIDDLITAKPYLAAQSGSRFQGAGDGGARNESRQTRQFTGEDVKRMTPQQIVDAKAAGQLDDYLKS